MKIKIINKSNNQLPHYETKSSAGMDIKAYTPNEIILEPLERKIVKNDFFDSKLFFLFNFGPFEKK